jgi:hypothetical protein
VALELHERPLPQVFSGGISVDNLTWWFWVKAGIGFTLGAGAAYVAGVILWLVAVYFLPSLGLLRMFRLL